MEDEYVLVNNYDTNGDHISKDSVSDTLVHYTGEGTRISTQEALGNLCQILVNKRLLTSEEFGEVIGVSPDKIWFGRDRDYPL